MIKNIHKMTLPTKIKRRGSTLFNKTKVFLEPYGTVYIIGPFNYPLQLTLVPLIGSIAAGNCSVLLPSGKTPAVSEIIGNIINTTFNEEYVAYLSPDQFDNADVLKEKMDFIFFTGSTRIGKIVMQAAAKNLTPVILELGGKSPSIVTKDADLDLAAEQIIWSKGMNTGQTCVATDYVLVDKKIKNKLIIKFKNTIKEFYGHNLKNNNDYGEIIDPMTTNNFINKIEENRKHLISGGGYDLSKQYIELSLFDIPMNCDNSLMEEEIFGPLLPIISYDTLEQAISFVKNKDKPLAVYIFSKNKNTQKKILNDLSFGGGGINQTILHVAHESLPFGGIGESGIGSYHGKYSIDAFSHKKSIMYGWNNPFRRLAFPPYNKLKLSWLKKIL